MNKVTTRLKFVHQAPRKLRLISDEVRGLPAEKAVKELALMPQSASQAIRKALLSGVAAAKERGLDMSNLYISHISVDEGPKLRRFIPMSRGRSQRILKRMSHITVGLTDEALVQRSSKAYKKELVKQVGQKAEVATKPTTETVPVNQPIAAATETTKGSK